MPKVNVKYQLTADATVTVDQLTFQSKDVDEIKKDGTEMFPNLKAYVDDKIQIHLQMSGFSGKWKLAVWVIELNDDNKQIGQWIPCADNGLATFTDNINIKNILSGNFKISWP